YRAQRLSGAEKASDDRQRDCSENPDLFRKQPPHDELPVSSEGQSTHRLRRDGGCLQSTGQTTSWWRGHALDISRRSRRSSTQGCRPNQQPMERILAQNLLVRRGDRGRLYRLIILYIIWESHPTILPDDRRVACSMQRSPSARTQSPRGNRKGGMGSQDAEAAAPCLSCGQSCPGAWCAVEPNPYRIIP